MAELQLEGDQLRLKLSVAEKIEGVHGDLQAALSAVRLVEVLEDAHGAAGPQTGIKVGTRIPGVVEVGRVQGLHTKRFVAVHRDTPRGVRVGFDEGDFDEWIVGCAEPEMLAARITQASRRTGR
jgi:hypothetical protein